MSSALWAGISGLNSSSKELDVVANNLANVNTIGFKSGKTQFSDILSSSISGGSGGNMQVGRGVSVADIQTQFSTGSFETTGNATDAAIDGDGFFMVNDADGATYYTRAGAFHMDNTGVLVDNNGYKVQGKAIVNGEPSGPLTDIKMQGLKSAPSTTTTVSLGANLNSSTATGGQYNTSQTVYDSLGASHTLNTIFTKTEYNATGGYWGIEASLDTTAAALDSVNGLYFDNNGNMQGTYTGSIGAVTPTHTISATATTVGAGPGPGLNANEHVTLTRTAAGGWTIAQTGAAYAAMAITSANGADPVTIASDGTNNDISLDLTGSWATGDTAAFDITGATAVPSTTSAAGTATATLNRADAVTANGNMILAWNGAAWSITNNGGYAGAALNSATFPVTISLGSGTTDLTLQTGAGAWVNGDTITVALTAPVVSAVTETVAAPPTATAALNRPGMVYKDGTVTATRGATAGSWTFAGDYANASLVSADATTVRISLDGSGTTDVTLTLAGTWGAGDTAAFTLDHTATAGLRDIDLNLTGVTLPGGATIGNGNHVTWDVLGDDALDITQYSAASNINAVSADGYASGQLKGLSIDEEGRISGSFTNGQISELAQIILAKFTNPWGLNKMGSNLFGQTIVSGAAIQDNPGNSGMGTLTPNSLEMSNTDIASEFIKMITSQKAYQASAKVVTTQDAIMQVLMSLKQ